MEPPGEGGNRGPFLVVALAVALMFFPVVAGGESFFGRDITPFFHPMKQYLADAVRSGRLPLWNPLVAGGEPFLASLQPGVFYPGSILLYLLPFPHALDWLIVLHFALAGVGWILALRHEGCSAAAATLGALAFVLGGFFVSLGNFVNNLQTMSWAPWLVLAWGAYRRDPRIPRMLAFAGVCVLAFLGGEPQLLALLLAVILARGLLGPTPAAGGRARQVVAFAAAGALALLVAGIQLVPFVEFIGESVRTLPLDVSFAASRSQEPMGLVHLLIPPALGHGDYGFTVSFLASTRVPWLLSLYPGLVVAGFAALGLLAVGRRERWFWVAVSAIGLAFALGAHTPVYRTLFEALPPVRAFRYPEKFALLFAIAVPFLAAAGFDRWRARPEASLRPAGLAGAGGLVVLALGCLPGLPAALCGINEALLLCENPDVAAKLYTAVAWRLAALLIAAAGVFALCGRGTLGPGTAGWALVALAALDLVGAHRPVNPSVPSVTYTTPPWTAETLASPFDRRHEFRFRGTPVGAAMGEVALVSGAHEVSNMYLDYQALGPNTASAFGFPQQDGLQGVELKSVSMTHEAAIHGWADDAVRFLRMMNVRYYADPTATADTLADLVELARHPDLPIRLFEVPEPLPRAFVATGWEAADGPAAALRRSLSSAVPARRVVLEQAPSGDVAARAASSGRIVAATWEPERVRLITRTSSPSMLVLLDRWYPGWTARVDGQPARLHRANGVFRAVRIPAGEADVEFAYRPASLAIGAWLSALGLAVALAAGWWSVRHETSR